MISSQKRYWRDLQIDGGNEAQVVFGHLTCVERVVQPADGFHRAGFCVYHELRCLPECIGLTKADPETRRLEGTFAGTVGRIK
jgi:hypothetical protein